MITGLSIHRNTLRRGYDIAGPTSRALDTSRILAYHRKSKDIAGSAVFQEHEHLAARPGFKPRLRRSERRVLSITPTGKVPYVSLSLVRAANPNKGASVLTWDHIQLWRRVGSNHRVAAYEAGA